MIITVPIVNHCCVHEMLIKNQNYLGKINLYRFNKKSDVHCQNLFIVHQSNVLRSKYIQLSSTQEKLDIWES